MVTNLNDKNLYEEGFIDFIKKRKQKQKDDKEIDKLVIKTISKYQNIYDEIIKISDKNINEKEAAKFLSLIFKCFSNIGIEFYPKGKKPKVTGTYITIGGVSSSKTTKTTTLSVNVDLYSLEKLKKGQEPTQNQIKKKDNRLLSPTKINKIKIVTATDDEKIPQNKPDVDYGDDKVRVYRNSNEISNGEVYLEWKFGNMIKLKNFRFVNLEKPLDWEDEVGNFMEKYYGVSLMKLNKILKTNF